MFRLKKAPKSKKAKLLDYLKKTNEDGEAESSEIENKKKFEAYLNEKTEDEKKMFSNESWTISDQGLPHISTF